MRGNGWLEQLLFWAAEKLGYHKRLFDLLDDEVGSDVIDLMVDLAVQEKWDPDILKPGEADRLKALWKVWLRGMKWGETFTHGGYAPSQSHWDYHPWTGSRIFRRQQCGLRRGLEDAESYLARGLNPVKISYITASPANRDELALMKDPRFVQIWSFDKLRGDLRGKSFKAKQAINASVVAGRGRARRWRAAWDTVNSAINANGQNPYGFHTGSFLADFW